MTAMAQVPIAQLLCGSTAMESMTPCILYLARVGLSWSLAAPHPRSPVPGARPIAIPPRRQHVAAKHGRRRIALAHESGNILMPWPIAARRYPIREGMNLQRLEYYTAVWTARVIWRKSGMRVRAQDEVRLDPRHVLPSAGRVVRVRGWPLIGLWACFRRRPPRRRPVVGSPRLRVHKGLYLLRRPGHAPHGRRSVTRRRADSS